MSHQLPPGVNFSSKLSVLKCTRELKFTRSNLDRKLTREISLNATKKKEDIPLQQKALSGFLSLSSSPFSLYIPSPSTFLHRVDPRIKQIGSVYLFVLLTSTRAYGKATIAIWLLMVTLLNTPWRIAKPTLLPLVGLSTFYFILTAMFTDGSPPLLQSRVPTTNLENLPLIQSKPYSYVIFKLWFINITKKSLILAVRTTSLVFVALQSASLCLITTAPEQLAFSLRQLLSPFRVLRLPVEEIGFCLLLSVKFLTTVFDELRNLALGVAVRGVDWKRLGLVGSINLTLSVVLHFSHFLTLLSCGM
eukprot:g4591.t1